MIAEIIELEKILNQEINAYSKLEGYIQEKKETIVNGDIKRLKNIDYEIEKFNSIICNLEKDRQKATAIFGHENLSINDIIEQIEDNEQIEKLSGLKFKLKKIIENIQRQNKIINSLIEHSLKLIEYSVNAIVNVISPEIAFYNNNGKVKKSSNRMEISSVNHEV